MGSTGEDPNNGIDPSVGGLVWVRRRNGSWWPGRILGMDELLEGCVSTPRSGTPVKLLGREDASVDWYNLEKSKRVKAFRCGEYDACIDKAKSSAFNLSKKTVKYARREDAILHALKIENARLRVNIPDLSTTLNTQQDEIPDYESPSSSGESEDIDENLNKLSQSKHLDAIKEESKHCRTPNDSEDDGNEGVKRMKGLEDLGMGVESSFKRKRFHVREFLKKKSLTKVLECSTKMVSIPVVCEKMSLESNESKRNNSLVVNNNSDSTFENAIPLNAFKHASDASLMSKAKENEICSMVESPDNDYSEELFDVPLVAEEKQCAGPSQRTALSSQSSHVETSSGTVDVHNISQMIEKGTSEWHHLKGKRNSRSRKTDNTDDDEAETHLDSTRVLGGPHITEIPASQFRGRSWNAPQKSTADVAAAPHLRLLPYRQSRFTVNPKYDSSDFSLRRHIAPSALYEIAVEVKMSYRSQRVPYISLMSKFNGQPIIGHPIAIEVLNDGFCDDILDFSECYSSIDMVYEQKHLTKSPKTRRKGILSKKIRKLSSLTGSQQSRDDQKPVLKKVKGPSIACVPLKIVFSRINAALNSSIRSTPRLAGKTGV